MSIKRKNEEDGPLSLTARLQQFIGHGKTLQLDLEVSPSECLTWIESLAKTPTDDFRLSIETQEVKPSYRFTAQISSMGHRSYIEYGVVVGEIIQSPTSQRKSMVTLRFYHTIGSILSAIMIAGLCIVMAVVMVVSGLNAITPPTANRFLVQTILCYGGIAVFFLGMGLFAGMGILSGHRPLELVSAHLLKLNAEQNAAEVSA